ncbi:MAG TPA: S16 family serine protease [Ilumatobacter sp.]|nr:S16 family serine protease [Ilumatobacter sp.]
MTDTATTTLPEPNEAPPFPVRHLETTDQALQRAGLRRSGKWARVTGGVAITVAVVGLAGVAVASLLPSELVAETTNRRLGVEQPAPFARTPAAAQPVDDRIVFGDLGDLAQQYPPAGDIFFVTVTEPEQSVLSWVLGRDDPAITFLTKEDKYGVQTPQQRRVFSLESMRSSEQVAQYVALLRVGFDVTLVPGDVLIQDIVCLVPNDEGTECVTWSPSDEVLDPGDRILSVEGEELNGVEDLMRILVDRSAGDLVSMKIERPEVGQLDVEVELTASPEEPDRTIVGFYPFDTRRVELPFELNINTGSIGGPSAGLAFTLTLIDELTEGELTGGGDVAVTGTIELNGEVGAIGGLRQKASAVAQSGVKLFLVPTSQGEDDIAAARLAGGPDLEIVPVATLEEAIAALVAYGGDPIPPAPPVPTEP